MPAMSEWRRAALDRLPEFREMIEATDTPLDLWVDLGFSLTELYATMELNDDLVRRIYDYAFWCLRRPERGTAVGSAAFMFFEHVAFDARMRNDLHRWLSVEWFYGLTEAFRCRLSKEEYAKFEQDFLVRAKGGSQIPP